MESLFIHGYEEEAKNTTEWQQLNKQLITPYNAEVVEEENYVKPFSNSRFLWVDSDLDYVNGMVSTSSLKKIILHYRIWKSDRNTETNPRVVLLVHGVGSSTAGWRHCIDSLLEKYEMVVAMDLPGFGFSSRTIGLSHSRWNRAFWCIQLMNQISKSILVAETQILWTIFSHSMSCLFCPCLIWMVNQKEWTNFENYLTDSNSKRFFQIDHLIMASGTYFQSNLSEMLSYSVVQSITRMTLRMIMGKTAMSFILKSSFNRNPTNEELLSYTIPIGIQNSIDCFVDILISFKADDEQFSMEKHLEILNQLTKWCRVTQIVAKLDNVHSMEEALKFKTILESQESSKNGKFVYKLFENASHCLMETEIDDFNNFISNELQ
ncbi:predicted protein [Naegleria gruberi]|uniref:Predicted protein n=1 Tax=Naegleria gruberi TaxID=5762 RepID=D2W3V8_NAEGR|nr:uncharacterized protein NAEGRDRAFT_76082 [Naegleria gruberi]EFC36263.1 predicted protein [Naegleria gruberi]|eukprot:XP_002669007.1 predicted protein [Naegleria gruberi strain NEG-M]